LGNEILLNATQLIILYFIIFNL